jgi:hypothetical protein
LSAPVPAAPTSTPKESILTVPDAEALAAGGDPQACRDGTRRLRLAGVAVPPPLLALAALDIKFHRPPAQAQPQPAPPAQPPQ